MGPVECDKRPKKEFLHRLDQVDDRLSQWDSTTNFVNPPSSLENIRLFKGSEHLLQFLRLHTVEWMCTFDMAWLVAHSYDL